MAKAVKKEKLLQLSNEMHGLITGLLQESPIQPTMKRNKGMLGGAL
jgi:hypothetical protein